MHNYDIIIHIWDILDYIDNFFRNHAAKVFLLHLLIYMVTLIALPALATESVPLLWNPNVDSNVAGYKIYYGGVSQVYTNSVDVGNVTNATISGLTENTTYYFAAKTYDASGDESGFSDETSANTTNSPTDNSTTAATLTPASCVNGQFALCVSGVTNCQCVVQASTNLVDWVSVQTNTAPFAYVDSNASQYSQRFYRTVNLP
jgi:hypothetical protein